MKSEYLRLYTERLPDDARKVRIARFPNPDTVYSPSLSALLVTLPVTFTSTGNCYKPTLADSRLTLFFYLPQGVHVRPVPRRRRGGFGEPGVHARGNR